MDKRYHALVQGHPDPLRGTVDAPIGRHPSGDGRFAVVSDGRPSVTHYDTLEAFRAASLVSVHLETGRTHQIRVHMAALRHPCVGDLLYGANPVLAARLGLTRQWLHAVSLTFAHPADGREVTFTSDYPDLAHALDVLRAESSTRMENAEHVDMLRRQGEWLADAAERAGLDALVPPCPPWQVRDLLRHTGYIHRWAARHLTECPDHVLDGPPEEEILAAARRPRTARLAPAGHAALRRDPDRGRSRPGVRHLHGRALRAGVLGAAPGPRDRHPPGRR